jgi:hypothetical protein
VKFKEIAKPQQSPVKYVRSKNLKVTQGIKGQREGRDHRKTLHHNSSFALNHRPRP